MIPGIVRKIYSRVKRINEINKYNDFTIAEYFRKQGAQIGDDCRIEIRSLGAEPHLVTIENHCTIAPGVAFLTHDGGTWLFTHEIPSLQKFGPIEIKENCFIGACSIILPNIKIGPNSIVGTGSIVTKDVPPNSIVGGNPAKFISSTEEYKEKVISAWKSQKPKEYMQDFIDGNHYSAMDIHKAKLRDFSMLKRHLIKYFYEH